MLLEPHSSNIITERANNRSQGLIRQRGGSVQAGPYVEDSGFLNVT